MLEVSVTCWDGENHVLRILGWDENPLEVGKKYACMGLLVKQGTKWDQAKYDSIKRLPGESEDAYQRRSVKAGYVDVTDPSVRELRSTCATAFAEIDNVFPDAYVEGLSDQEGEGEADGSAAQGAGEHATGGQDGNGVRRRRRGADASPPRAGRRRLVFASDSEEDR
jgi:hypothetical protein